MSMETDFAKVIADTAHPAYVAGIGLCLWRIWQLEKRIDRLCEHFGVPRKPEKRSKAFPVLCVATFAVMILCGCVKTRVTDGSVTLESTRFLWPGKIAKAEIVSTNGSRLTLEGYQSDAAQLAGQVAEGVTKGLGQAVKP